jgi:hypothetical protein
MSGPPAAEWIEDGPFDPLPTGSQSVQAATTCTENGIQLKRSHNMQHIRLATCGLTPFSDDIVRTIVEDVPFVELVGSLEPSDDLGADFVRSNADVMVCAIPEQEMDRLWHAALAERPPLAVLNMVDDHTRGRLHALYPHGHTVEELTEVSLLDALCRHLRALRNTLES